LSRAAQHPDLLVPLASVLVDQPRLSLLGLAKAVGVSKATLYRLCRTRDELTEQLVARALAASRAILEEADLASAPPLEALRRMTRGGLRHSELAIFLMHHCNNAKARPEEIASWEAELDAFFLRGQREKVFRVDVPAPTLTDLWSRQLIGLLDAERRGRIARSDLPNLIETIFLHGVSDGSPR